jgi:hypothetical protein
MADSLQELFVPVLLVIAVRITNNIGGKKW